MTERHQFIAGLIADDVTGANDAAVQFALDGWTTLLILAPDALAQSSAGLVQSRAGLFKSRAGLAPQDPPCMRPGVMAVSTDVRALGNEIAERVTARAVQQLLEAGVDRIYLKVDSTMRGSVSGQISGALAGWRAVDSGAFAAICPAYPKMGRTVEGNHVLVDGVPVERSPIGKDAVTPVHTADLAVLIPGSTYMKKVYAPFSWEEADKGPYPFFTFDAQSDQDLDALASALVKAGRAAIPVGSAGLAKAMAAVWTDDGPAKAGHYAFGTAGLRTDAEAPVRSVRLQPDIPPNPRILIQVTSRNPVSIAQTARLSALFPDVRVVTGRAEEASVVFEEYVKSEKWDVLGFVGGDGARAGMQRLGASAIRIVDSLIEGVPLGVIVAGQADGIPVFTKAGGFGAEDALARIVERLRA